MPALQVVALISGGKDSLFSILHCQRNGHKVVALANLHPAPEANISEDMDSYMYQTVGHSVVEFYAEALDIPLYRQNISGRAVNTSQIYSNLNRENEHDADETESLVPLLRLVKTAHPEVNAVSSGAILSTYQRTRVESIALRLGLVPLAFLWQYPMLPPLCHTALLSDMAAVGMDARIIKVASGGLDEAHLWQNVAENATIAKLKRDVGRFGPASDGSVLGEGGEYETLAVDGPPPLWKKHIIVTPNQRKIYSDGGGVVRVRVTGASLKVKEDCGREPPAVRLPDLLDTEFAQLQQKLNTKVEGHELSRRKASMLKPIGQVLHCSRPSERVIGQQIFLSNISSSLKMGIHDQLTFVLAHIVSRLAAFDLTPNHIVLTTILLRTMTDFAEVNNLYATLFTGPNPPARITIACGDLMSPNALASVSIVASTHPLPERFGLHVQSRSYWAPANIGPYSQAIADPLRRSDDTACGPRLVYVAGQIPLVPASMEMGTGPFSKQAVLALQHLWRIGRAMQVHCWLGAVAYITASDPREAAERAAIAVDAWEWAHKDAGGDEDDEGAGLEDETFDVGDAHLRRQWTATGVEQDEISLASIPDCKRVMRSQECMRCLVAQVSELPRAAPVEWVARGLNLDEAQGGHGTKAIYQHRSEGFDECTEPSSNMSVRCAVAYSVSEVRSVCEVLVHGVNGSKIFSVEAFTTENVEKECYTWLLQHAAQVIPCKRLWDKTGAVIFALKISSYSQTKQ